MTYYLGSRMRSPVMPDIPDIPDVGECYLTLLGNGRIHIDRADPRTLIDAYMLDEIRAGRCNPDVRLNGDLLTIDAVNQKVIYRVGEKVPDRHSYVLEWPD